jgi:Uma2 family endonuclease
MQVVVTEEAVLNLEDMSDDEFFEFCVRNPEYRIERGADGRVTIMSGTGGRTGNRNIELGAQLQQWARRDQRGIAFDSSTLFLLPNGAMRSPDAAWVPRARLSALSDEQKEKFLPLCPEFLVELTSPSDRLAAVKKKMIEWMANGCRLGWILDVQARRAHIYRPGGVEILNEPAGLDGEGPVKGFRLELSAIWDPGW